MSRKKSNPAPPEPADEVARLGALMHRFMDHVNRTPGGGALAIIHESGLTLPQMVAMHIVRAREGLDLGSVSDHLRLTPSTTSHLVDRLVEKDLMERWENPGDRRQKLLRLTQAGREVVDRISQARAAEFTRVLGGLPPELKQRLVGVFQDIVAQLEEDNRS